MGTILEALAVIKGRDATGPAFDQVAAKINRIARATRALNGDVQKQLHLAAGAEHAAIRMGRASTMIGHGAKMAAGAAAAYGGTRALSALGRETVKVSADRAHEKARMSVSGMSDAEIKEAGDLSGAISRKYPSLSQTEIMHTARNVRSMVGTYEEAAHVLEPLAKLRVVALGAHPERAAELNEDFDKLAKGMEIKGVTQNLPKFIHYIDNMAKALNVFGDTLRPVDYYEMFKYGRAATNALSDEFMLKTAPTLAQELGGSSAGKALSSFHTQFVGGKMSNKAVEALNEYGLIDPKKVIKTSTGHVKGVKPGGIVGGEYLRPGQEDPYAWVQKVLLPHLAAKGVTDPAKIQEVIAAIASQATTAQMLAILATQPQRIEKDWALVHGAKGIEAANTFQKDDPKVIAKGGLALKQFATLNQMTVEAMRSMINSHEMILPFDRFKREFTYLDALEIEVARQLADKDGVPLTEAVQLTSYTSAVGHYAQRSYNGTGAPDFWLAVTASRNTWGDHPRGSWPVTGFGPNEYWAELHFTGSFGEVTGEIAIWIGRDQVQHPDSDPARIILANVSAADRRLRKRAAELGIELKDQ